jgi:hypothetical protein
LHVLDSQEASSRSIALARRRRFGPVAALLLLAPIIAEVLFGVTRVTTLFVLLPQIGAWGCGALLIRELARRRGLGWLAILLLGIAFAIAEECIVQQTSLAPLVGVDPNHVYSRALGVNWVYLLWALIYESVWAVVIPIQCTELIFPACRHEPWLGTRGLLIAGASFGLALLVAWYSWTQLMVPKLFPESAYSVPPLSMAIAAAAIVLIIIIALRMRPKIRIENTTHADLARPWQVGVATFVLGLPWFALVYLAYGGLPSFPFLIPAAAGLAWATAAFGLINYWASSLAWDDARRLTACGGAVAASMLAGSFIVKASGAPMVDIVGNWIFDATAIVLFVLLARRIRRSWD